MQVLVVCSVIQSNNQNTSDIYPFGTAGWEVLELDQAHNLLPVKPFPSRAEPSSSLSQLLIRWDTTGKIVRFILALHFKYGTFRSMLSCWNTVERTREQTNKQKSVLCSSVFALVFSLILWPFRWKEFCFLAIQLHNKVDKLSKLGCWERLTLKRQWVKLKLDANVFLMQAVKSAKKKSNNVANMQNAEL